MHLGRNIWNIDQSQGGVSLAVSYQIRDSLLLLVVLLLSLVVFLAIGLLLGVLLPVRAQLLMLTIVLLWGLLVALVVISLGLGLVVVATILGLVVVATVLGLLGVVVRHFVRVVRSDVKFDALTEFVALLSDGVRSLEVGSVVNFPKLCDV